MSPFGPAASRIISLLSAATLAVLGVVGNKERPWVWVLAIVCALVVVTLEFVRIRREKNTPSRLGRNFEIIQGSMLRLTADLADLTAKEFDLWVIDLYLPAWRFSLSRLELTRELRRSLSIALTDVRTVPSEFSLVDAFVGPSFTDSVPRIWWNIQLAPTTDENYWDKLNDAKNEWLVEKHGVVSVNPVLNSLGADCRGLLAIHGKADAETVTKILGVLQQSEGKRRVAAACREIHSQLGKS